jgi:uncharacterized protein (TIGR01777 family)
MKNKSNIVLAGGSGFLGKALAAALVGRGYPVAILSRSPRQRRTEGITEVLWDGKSAGKWMQFIDGAEAVVNLTGKSVNCRYTPASRREIIESRTGSVRALAAAIEQCAVPPKAWVQASSLAIYGDTGDRWCDEYAPHAGDFPAETCKLWEQAFDSVPLQATRKVILRISFALGRDEGALGTLAGLARWFLGGAVGTGRQYISWIHIADLTRMFLAAIEEGDVAGVFNASTANPVTNAEFMRQLRHVLKRPWSPPVPAWVARIGAWAMRTEASLALTGRRAAPRRFRERGFEFQFPELRPALDDLYGRRQ